MILAIVLLVVAGLIYYSTHQIPPDPIFQQEVYVSENDFWDDMEESDFQEEIQKKAFPEIKTISLPPEPKKPKVQKVRQDEKLVEKRRKKRRIAKKSRQQNRK
jgi:hypothetical protein